MEKIYKTISENCMGEFIEKKSKFIAYVYYVEDIVEAENRLNDLKKKHFDAKHICYSYSINGVNKSCDDGEPSRTAGEPILNIITKNNLGNILIAVVRYFGGILLGTGGLVKAYTTATLNALENTDFIEEQDGEEIEIKVKYSEIEKLKYYCKKNNIKIVSAQYENEAIFIIEVNNDDKEKIEKNIEYELVRIVRNKKIRK